MPHQRGSRRSFGSSPARRRSSWEVGPGASRRSISTIDNPAFIGLVANPVEDGLTLVRIRGDLYVRLTAAAAAGEFMHGWVGIGLTSAEGTAAGIGSVPTPVAELNAESWLWMHFWSVESVTDAEAVDRGGVGGYHVPIDTKAMRKLSAGQSLYAAVEAEAETGTVTASFTLDTRMLVLLP